jgi:hypothetical protein
VKWPNDIIDHNRLLQQNLPIGDIVDTRWSIGTIEQSFAGTRCGNGCHFSAWQMFVRLDCLPIHRGTELDVALPLRELSTSNLFPNNDMDLSPTQRVRVHEGRAPVFPVFARRSAWFL